VAEQRPGEGLDLSRISEISPEEVNAHLIHVWSWRGPLYELYANSLMLDYAPDFAKLHRWGADLFGRPSHTNVILFSSQNIHSYMMLGWETGILNEFNTLRRNGMSKEEIMELVMFSQLYAGMRGLGHVYRAVGDFLPALAGPGEPRAPYPDGWAADPDAFKAGLDLSTREVTPADRQNLEAWYESTIGYMPDSVLFGLRYHPEFTKVNRAKWEVAIRTLPKQLAPYLMIRHNVVIQSVEGLKEAVLLGKAWGISKQHVIQGVTCSAGYFTGIEGLHTAHTALEQILDNW
jgi:hypothetical protein